MTPEELSNLYICIAFQYESALNRLVDKGLVDKDLADTTRKTFYDSLDEEKLRTSQKIRNYTEIIRRYMQGMICENMVSLTEQARQYSANSPGYAIQSWMRSRNTLEFLRQWENNMWLFQVVRHHFIGTMIHQYLQLMEQSTTNILIWSYSLMKL